MKWMFNSVMLRWRLRNNNLSIRYMATAINVEFGKFNTIYENSFIANSSLGDGTYVGVDSRIINSTIGYFCSIGPEVVIGCGRHAVNEFVSSHPSFYSTANQAGFSFANKNEYTEYLPISIGDDVWIGLRVIILDGVKIGTGAIIAAGSVVTNDVEEYSIVGGVPAKVIRRRFSDEVISLLKKHPWHRKSFSEIRDMPKTTSEWLAHLEK